MIFTFIGIVLITLFMSGQSAALVSGSRLSRSGGSKENALQKNIRVLSNRPSVAFLSVSGRKDSIDSSNVADGVFKWYNDKLEKHPMLTKVVSSGVIGGLSDVLIQTLNARKGKLASFDFRRTAVFSAVCAFYFAPVINTWFNMLSKIPFPARISDTSKVLGMVAIDQTVGNAIVTAGFFYAFEIIQRLIPPYGGVNAGSFITVGNLAVQRSLLKTMQASWCYWPFINFFNFRFVPLQYRVLFSNLASVFWNMYLTCVANA